MNRSIRMLLWASMGLVAMCVTTRPAVADPRLDDANSVSVDAKITPVIDAHSTDMNGNGIMDLGDFAIFAGFFTAGLPAPAANFDCSPGAIPDLADFAIFANSFAAGVIFFPACRAR